MGGGEILLIFLAILVLFGADKMPGMARSIGKGMREFQKAADEIKSELVNSTSDIRSEMNNIRSDIRENVSETKQALTETKNDFNSSITDNSVDFSVKRPEESYRVYEEAQNLNIHKPEEPHVNDKTDKKDEDMKFLDIGANI